jgi:hypothetical protein
MTKNSTIYRIGALVLVLVVLALLGAIILDHLQRSRAQHLAAQIKLLAIETTGIDATQIIQRFGGRKVEFPSPKDGSGNSVLGISPCSDADAVYAIGTGPKYKLNRILAYFPGLDRLGLHPWDVSVSLFFKNQKLICFSETARTWQPNGDAVFAQVYMIFSQLPSLDAKTYKVSSLRLRGNIYRLEVNVSSKSTVEERERAFTLDLRCVTTSAGCASPGEIMPLSWQRYLQTRAATN